MRPAIEALCCDFDAPVPGKDVYVVKGFAARFGMPDPKAAQAKLRDEYPHLAGTEPIPWGKPQWITGNHKALRMRGNELAREKMWFQDKDPKEHGFRKYFYTGWQYAVMPATAWVGHVPWLEAFVGRINRWLADNDHAKTNHYIVTAYEKEDCGIGMHYDKEKSIDPESVIIVVKTGACGRPFCITENNGKGGAPDAELFNEVVAPGDAVIMTMKANLETKHGVPILKEPTGVSGSIVLRTITEKVAWDELEAFLSKKRAREEARED